MLGASLNLTTETQTSVKLKTQISSSSETRYTSSRFIPSLWMLVSLSFTWSTYTSFPCQNVSYTDWEWVYLSVLTNCGSCRICSPQYLHINYKYLLFFHLFYDHIMCNLQLTTRISSTMSSMLQTLPYTSSLKTTTFLHIVSIVIDVNLSLLLAVRLWDITKANMFS
jgi:hypothetical protein